MNQKASILCVIVFSTNIAHAEQIPCDNAQLKITEGEARALQEETGTRMTYVEILSEEGSRKAPMIAHHGHFYSLCEEGKFLLLDSGLKYEGTDSWVMKSTGEVIAELHVSEIRRVDKSNDHKLFAIQSSNVEDGEPVTEITVYAHTGDILKSTDIKLSAHEESPYITIEYEDKEYTFDVHKPELPG